MKIAYNTPDGELCVVPHGPECGGMSYKIISGGEKIYYCALFPRDGKDLRLPTQEGTGYPMKCAACRAAILPLKDEGAE